MRSDFPSVHFVKISAKIISPYISKLYNKYVEFSVFPESLKFSEVIPIYKFRKKITFITIPISFLSPFNKIFEFLVCERLKSFFVE